MANGPRRAHRELDRSNGANHQVQALISRLRTGPRNPACKARRLSFLGQRPGMSLGGPGRTRKGVRVAKRKRYTDEFRASAVLFLESEGYPEKKGALMSVSRKLKVSHTTLHSWFHAKHNPPPQEVRHLKKLEIVEIIRNEIYAALAAAPTQRELADYKELITSAAILIDKLQLLENKPTERVAHEHTISDGERAKRLNELLDAARTRRTGLSTGADGSDVVH